MQGFGNQTEPSNHSFKFGEVVHKSTEIMDLLILTPNWDELNFNCNTANADVPLLSGLDILKRENLVVNLRDLKLQDYHWPWFVALVSPPEMLFFTFLEVEWSNSSTPLFRTLIADSLVTFSRTLPEDVARYLKLDRKGASCFVENRSSLLFGWLLETTEHNGSFQKSSLSQTCEPKVQTNCCSDMLASKS